MSAEHVRRVTIIMKITKQQLRKIINEERAQLVAELHPRDVADAEYDQQLLNDLGGMYSDMYKELYRRRPNIPMFKTIEEAEAAVEELWGEYAAKNRAREEQERQDLEYIEMERRRQELMPGEFDYEHVPRRSGMGRRTESMTRATRQRLKGIIKEATSEAMTNDEIEALEIIEEMGYNHDLPITHMENQTAIRDAMAGYPEWVTMETIESAVRKEALNIARRPVLDPAMLEILYELTPADEMEGWDDDPGLWAAVKGDFYPDSEVAWLWAGSPAGWVRFGIYEEDIWDMDEIGLDFFNWMNKQGANVRMKKGSAPKKLMHMLSMG